MKKYLPFVIVALMLWSLLRPVQAQGPGLLRVHFLDVDQGDAILLDGPDFTILIDAGRHDRNDVLPHLTALGVEGIDLLVGTHPHADHIGQFPEVLATYVVTEVWMSGDTNTTATFEAALDAILAEGAAYREPRAGEVYNIGSARIEIVNPTTIGGELNDGSVAFRLVFGDVAFMFTGDAELEAELAMVNSGHALGAQILKLGHHGSNTSSSLPFLQAVDPEIAIWSAGANNSFGHPHAATLNRLAQMSVEVHGTATEGTILVCTDGQTYTVGECAAAPAFPFRLLLPDLAFNPVDGEVPTTMPTIAATTTPTVTPTATEQQGGPTATSTTTPTPTSTATPTATATKGQGGPTATHTPTNTATVTPTATEVVGAVCNCSGNLYNCPDFDTQAEAQACHDYCESQGAGDIHGLDGNDDDGLACENLPPNFHFIH